MERKVTFSGKQEPCDFSRGKFRTEADFFNNNGDYVILGWDYIKWYSSYKDVKAILNILKELNTIVEKDCNKLSEYFYKIIEVGEDNATTEYSNDDYCEYTANFYVYFKFNL